jgi:5'-3' exonuclease
MRHLLVDGNHLSSRVRHAQRDLRTTDGRRSGVVFGTVQGLSYVRNTLKLELPQVWVVWDGGRAEERTKLYPGYKNRPTKVFETALEQQEDEEEHASYIAQLKALREGLAHAGVRQVRVGGCEADDLISILAHQLHHEGEQPIIFSGDHDYHQLCEIAEIFDPKDDLLEKDAILADWGVEQAEDILLLKALQGDDSDKIKGVPQIGPKKAALVLKHVKPVLFGGETTAPADKKTAGALELVMADLATVRRNLKLMQLPSSWDQFPYYNQDQFMEFLGQIGTKPKPNKLKFVKFLQHWECNSIIDRLERW